LPIGDAAHVRNALARFGQTFFESLAKARSVWGHITSAAKRFGIKHDDTMPKARIKQPSSGCRRASVEDRQGRLSHSETLISVCAVAIEADEAPEWIELIPAGKFSALDGRGPFENQDPEAIVAASVAKMPQVGLVLDYDHSTDLAAPEGRPAPAAGWLKQFKVNHGAIFARIEWTKDAAVAIKEKKYRYVSPVFEHSEGGKVERILRAALTNNPALINLPALASATLPILKSVSHAGAGETGLKVRIMAKKETMADGEKSLSEIVAGLEELFPDMSHKQILEMAMGALDDDDGYDSNTHVDDGIGVEQRSGKENDRYQHETAEQMARRHEEEMSRCSSDVEREECTRRQAAEKERFVARSSGAVDQRMSSTLTLPSPATERERGRDLAEMVAKHPMVLRMAADLNQMRSAQARKTAEAAVDSAIREGRLVPSQREWAVEYCSADPNGFERFIGAQPKILQSGADGTFTGCIGEVPADALTQKELMVCENLGVSAEKFAAAKKARLSRNVTLD